MSSPAAVAATTELIKGVLLSATTTVWPKLDATPRVSTVPPDLISTDAGDQLNVFLYRTAVNPAWRNVGLPVRSSNGARITQPPLGLDLHYLVSAHAKTDLHAELLLGFAMEALHGMTALTANAIRTRFAGAIPTDVDSKIWALLSACGLDEQPEQVTVTLENMSIDDLSKLWSVLGEKYRPSAAYVATVVLIQPQGPVRAVLPVTRAPVPVARPMLRPSIESLQPTALDWGSVVPLRLFGSNLVGDGARVVFGSTIDAPVAATSTSAHVEVLLPPGVPAGATSVRVRHTALTSGSGLVTTLEQSNAVGLLVKPVVVASVPSASTVRVDLKPDIAVDQDVQLLLNAADGVSFTLPARPRTTATSAVVFGREAVPAGTYLLRVRVDGAESELTVDAKDRFDGPVGVLP